MPVQSRIHWYDRTTNVQQRNQANSCESRCEEENWMVVSLECTRQQKQRAWKHMEKREIILGWGFVLHLGIEGRRGSRALSVVHSCVLPIVTPFSPSNHLSGTLPDESQPSCNVFSSIWHLVRAYQTSGQITGFLHRVVTFGSHACLVISLSGCLLQKPPGAERVKLAHDWWSLELKKNKPCWT